MYEAKPRLYVRACGDRYFRFARRGLIVSALALGAAAIFWGAARHLAFLEHALRVNSFRLTTHKGEIVNSRALLGRPYAVFFGFTRCPGACPTMLTQIAQLLNVVGGELGGEAKGFRVYFVSLDPERDTPAALAEYLSSFGPSIVGLTGAKADVEAAAKSFHAYYRVVPIDGGDYLVEHAAVIYLVDAQGRSVDTIAMGEGREVALAKLRALIHD